MKTLTTAFFALLTLSLSSQTIDIAIDLDKEYQTIEGFGAASPEWANLKNKRPEVPDMMMNDLEMEILRVYPLGEFYETVNDNDDPYVLDYIDTTDRNVTRQMEVIRAFKNQGLEKLILSVFSPPAWMKYNNRIEETDCQADNPECQNRMMYNMYEEFAEFYVAYIKLIEKNTGMKVYAISPQNEPAWGQPYASCVYNAQEMRDVIKVLGKRLQDEGIDVKLFAAEHLLDWFGEMESVMMADSVCKSYTDVLATHAYADGITPTSIAGAAEKWSQAKDLVQKHGKELWMTETSGFPEDWKTGPMAYGQLIHTALKYGDLSGWVWLNMNTDAFNPQEALMISQEPRKIYYSSKNFYKFITSNAVRVNCLDNEDEQILATTFKHSSNSRLTVVVLNTSDTEKKVNLLMENGPLQYMHYRTSESEDFLEIGSVGSEDIILTPYSINTFTSKGSNSLPEMVSLSDMDLLMNTHGKQMVTLKGISDGDDFTQELTVTASSSNTDLIADPVITYTSGEDTALMELTPISDKSGVATITVILQDNGSQDNNGFFSKTKKTFQVKVHPFVNKTPTIDQSNDLVISADTTLLLTGISDGNDGSQEIIITVDTITNDVIHQPGITFTTGENTASILIQPKKLGQATINITLIDNGDTLFGGSNEKTMMFNVEVVEQTSLNAISKQAYTGVVIYPNPVKDKLTIKTEKQIQTVELYTLLGKLHKTYNYKMNKEVLIDLPSIPKGTYIVRVNFNDGFSHSEILTID